MASNTIRTPVVLPRALVDAVDDLVGQRKRSAFVAEAVAEKVEWDRFGRALANTGDSLNAETIPNGKRGKISAWVREMRAIDNAIGNRKLARFRSS